MTGIYRDQLGRTRADMQAFVYDTIGPGQTYGYHERPLTPADADTLYGYTNTSFPSTGLYVWTVSYFDDYDFDGDGTPDATFEPVAAFPSQPTEESTAFGSLALDGHQPFYRLRDKQTRQRVRVLTTNGGLGTGGTLDGVFGPGS